MSKTLPELLSYTDGSSDLIYYCISRERALDAYTLKKPLTLAVLLDKIEYHLKKGG